MDVEIEMADVERTVSFIRVACCVEKLGGKLQHHITDIIPDILFPKILLTISDSNAGFSFFD